MLAQNMLIDKNQCMSLRAMQPNIVRITEAGLIVTFKIKSFIWPTNRTHIWQALWSIITTMCYCSSYCKLVTTQEAKWAGGSARSFQIAYWHFSWDLLLMIYKAINLSHWPYFYFVVLLYALKIPGACTHAASVNSMLLWATRSNQD